MSHSHHRSVHKWAVDFSEIRRKSRVETPSPPGFSHSWLEEDETADSSDHALLAKQGWSIALGPWKQLPMNLFVLWLAGNSISLFPIMMVGMMFFRPVQSLFSYRQVFDKLKGDQAIMQKLMYILANLIGIALAVYKFNSMGLLPTSPSDWLEFIDVKTNLEVSGGGAFL